MNYYTVDGWNNFCRVFELPEKFSSEFCFGSGIPTTFMMVDWFNPVPDIPQPAISKEEWEAKGLSSTETLVDYESIRFPLEEFLKRKRYVKPGRRYLVLTEFGLTFEFTGGEA